MDSIRRMSIALAIAAAAVGLIGCMTASVSKDEKSEAADTDKQIEEWLAEPDKAEARKWLQSDSHILFEGDKETAAKLVSDLYSAGAKEVWIIGIEQLADSEVAAAFVAVLPGDTATRRGCLPLNQTFRNSWTANQPATLAKSTCTSPLIDGSAKCAVMVADCCALFDR